MFFRPLLLISLGLALAAQAQPTFRAGVATVDISPTEFPRIIAGGFLEGRGEKLADKLFVRSFELDDGKMKIAFAIVDTCMMEQALMDEAKGIATKQCGIPVERMMVSATHTHTAPGGDGLPRHAEGHRVCEIPDAQDRRSHRGGECGAATSPHRLGLAR